MASRTLKLGSVYGIPEFKIHQWKPERNQKSRLTLKPASSKEQPFGGAIIMFSFVVSLFSFLFGVWQKIPAPIKQKIIESIVNSFEDFFRGYYRRSKSK